MIGKPEWITYIEIGDVAATSFVTLYCHAIESQSKDQILDDPKAVEITHELNKILSASIAYGKRCNVSFWHPR
jgi:O-methyltransferase involved in polyketide biosynthesis